MTKSSKPLSGRTYLILEDEYLIASDLLIILEGAGAKVYGPISDVRNALEILKGTSLTLDAAVLDINLAGDMVYPIASLLMKRGTPFIFATGYECSPVPEEFKQAPCLSKPTLEADLISALLSVSAALPN
ncbi:response regulator [Shinella curvata]|uniref:Response regulator n=1 Tax=Shinella curvata TaxID=1817964 RepID=A0ABT8XKJ3_9HYPH|nr:response regulator [Shinella curvata]MCJ8056919.1 response regulator [Shinella curvata]MDO6124254.1 response regulator [Shinella curvata]